MLNKKPSALRSVISLTIAVVILASAAWLIFNRQYALDQLSVWNFQPSSAVAAISNKVKFTPKGQFIFYATKPQVENQENFNETCPRQESASPILGCYTTNGNIFIYNLTNPQLSGMEEVTAAHEMLHAVWARTGSTEREELTKELEQAYSKIDDSELKSRMDYYQRTEPGEFANELHSILGTEEVSLGEPLDSYYEQFFSRSAVLEFHDQYSKVYDQLYNRADELRGLMAGLSSTINSETDAYNAAVAQLSADIADFNRRANNGGFSSMAAFNRERAALVARSNALDSDRATINAHIDTYDTYYKEYQDIASQIQVLNDSTDSFKQIDEAPSV